MSLELAGYQFDKLFPNQTLDIYTFNNRLGPTGDFEKIKDADVVISNCANILGTIRRTRVMDCSFGSDLIKYCYQPLDSETVDEIKDEIRESISTQEERAIISQLDVMKTADGKGLEINITLIIAGVPHSRTIQITPDAFAILSE